MQMTHQHTKTGEDRFYFSPSAYGSSVLIDSLKRIFRRLDDDKDGLLSDREIHAFQVEVFLQELDVFEMRLVKRSIDRNISDGTRANKITIRGFLWLVNSFLEDDPMAIERILVIYGFLSSGKLIASSYQHPQLKITPHFQGALIYPVQLTALAVQFLQDVFLQFAVTIDESAVLTASAADALFDSTEGLKYLCGVDLPSVYQVSKPSLLEALQCINGSPLPGNESEKYKYYSTNVIRDAMNATSNYMLSSDTMLRRGRLQLFSSSSKATATNESYASVQEWLNFWKACTVFYPQRVLYVLIELGCAVPAEKCIIRIKQNRDDLLDRYLPHVSQPSEISQYCAIMSPTGNSGKSDLLFDMKAVANTRLHANLLGEWRATRSIRDAEGRKLRVNDGKMHTEVDKEMNADCCIVDVSIASVDYLKQSATAFKEWEEEERPNSEATNSTTDSSLKGISQSEMKDTTHHTMVHHPTTKKKFKVPSMNRIESIFLKKKKSCTSEDLWFTLVQKFDDPNNPESARLSEVEHQMDMGEFLNPSSLDTAKMRDEASITSHDSMNEGRSRAAALHADHQPKLLLLREEHSLMPEILLQYDVLCIMYDCSQANSLQYTTALLKWWESFTTSMKLCLMGHQHNKVKFPRIVLLASRSNYYRSQQRHNVALVDHCEEKGLQLPIPLADDGVDRFAAICGIFERLFLIKGVQPSDSSTVQTVATPYISHNTSRFIIASLLGIAAAMLYNAKASKLKI